MKETQITTQEPQGKKKKKQQQFVYGKKEQTQEDQPSQDTQNESTAETMKSQKKKQGKKGKQSKEQPEEEGEEEEKETKKKVAKGDEGEEEEKGNKDTRMPVNVVYCQYCRIPPEYCSYYSSDLEKCKESLKESHPQLFNSLFGGAEESKGEGQEKQEKVKQKKKVQIGQPSSEPGSIKVIRQKSKGSKIISMITGLQNYGVSMKDMAKAMSKFFACSASYTTDDQHGDVIKVQGDVEMVSENEDEIKLLAFFNAEYPQLNISEDTIAFEGAKKKVKKGGHK